MTALAEILPSDGMLMRGEKLIEGFADEFQW